MTELSLFVLYLILGSSTVTLEINHQLKHDKADALVLVFVWLLWPLVAVTVFFSVLTGFVRGWWD